MVTRSISFAEGEFYHVYNRGTDKRVIYKNSADYRRFQELLYLYNSTDSINVRDIKKHHKSVYNFEKGEQMVAIGAYCLMPNHFHILLRPLREDGVSTFLRKLTTSYSMYFNKRYDRKGGLFEGRYKAQHAIDDRYLKYLFAYIHLNPVKLIDPTWKEDGVANVNETYKYVSEYKYSSLMDYLHQDRLEKFIINISEFPEYFREINDIKIELFEWLSFLNE